MVTEGESASGSIGTGVKIEGEDRRVKEGRDVEGGSQKGDGYNLVGGCWGDKKFAFGSSNGLGLVS
jgi:hypothetical protein